MHPVEAIREIDTALYKRAPKVDRDGNPNSVELQLDDAEGYPEVTLLNSHDSGPVHIGFEPLGIVINRYTEDGGIEQAAAFNYDDDDLINAVVMAALDPPAVQS